MERIIAITENRIKNQIITNEQLEEKIGELKKICNFLESKNQESLKEFKENFDDFIIDFQEKIENEKNRLLKNEIESLMKNLFTYFIPATSSTISGISFGLANQSTLTVASWFIAAVTKIAFLGGLSVPIVGIACLAIAATSFMLIYYQKYKNETGTIPFRISQLFNSDLPIPSTVQNSYH